jgi:hypothetical protein
LSSCSNVPEGVESSVYKETSNLVVLIDDKLKNKENLTDEEKERLAKYHEDYFANKDITEEQREFQSNFHKLQMYYEEYIFAVENELLDLETSQLEKYSEVLYILITEYNISLEE